MPVYQYDSNGKFIKEFKNLKDVRNQLGKSLAKLSAHIATRTIYEEYFWSYDKVNQIDIPKPKKRKIEQYDLDGNLIKVWDSYRACEKEFSNLRYVLNGARASTKGYTFKYIS